MEWKIDWIGVVVSVLIALTGVILLWKTKTGWYLLVAIGLFLISFKFTLVQEAKAKGIIRLGAYKKIVIAWKGHKLDENGDVVAGQETHIGGLRYVGIRFIDDIYKYIFRWRGLELVEGKEEIEFHEKTVDYIQIKPDIYYTSVDGVETKAPGRIPVKLEWLVTMRIKNPRKTLWDAPENWNENVMARLNALFSMWVSSTKSLDDLLKIREKPGNIWNELKDDPLIRFFDENWGVEILKNGIELRAITPPKEYQDAAARQKQMELEAKGTAAELVGAVIDGMAKSRGKTTEDIQREIDSNNETKKEFTGLMKELLIIKMGIEGNAYVDIRVKGTGTAGETTSINSLEKMALDLLAAWKRMPSGGKTEGEGEKKKSSEEEGMLH